MKTAEEARGLRPAGNPRDAGLRAGPAARAGPEAREAQHEREPLSPVPPGPRRAACRHRSAVRLYPPPEADALRERAARVYGLAPSQVLCGNGSDEILAILMRTFVGEGDTDRLFPAFLLPVPRARRDRRGAHDHEFPFPASPGPRRWRTSRSHRRRPRCSS